ncbi:NAD(P)H-dependent oxidoreductase [uncultured Litoreibacter sp.]|uniref:NAD(P)H-dependent oxidoreductase n=1 Tax=uncultured Litoreibacter sp. TaxID=1392394 RepID=UPI002624D721|nr:NAD(P)H-dependent oxidoreductase [uncultured Litoreibacter sp.]
MPNKRIFILVGHPAETSLSRSLAETYKEAAQTSGNEVRITYLHDLDFDADFEYGGYSKHKPLEPCLTAFQGDLEWAEHFVLVTPMWWGGLPAKLKGLFDRTLLPGWAFDTRTRKMGLPLPLLTGRTARAVVTSDTPDFFFGLLYGKALLRQLKGQIFKFIGLKPVGISHFSQATSPKPEKVELWLADMRKLGTQGK